MVDHKQFMNILSHRYTNLIKVHSVCNFCLVTIRLAPNSIVGYLRSLDSTVYKWSVHCTYGQSVQYTGTPTS